MSTNVQPDKEGSPSRKRPRGPIYEYFEDLLDSSMVKCRVKSCGLPMTQSATVMSRHLMRQHKNLHEEFQKKNSDFKNENMATEPKRAKPESSKMHQIKIEQAFKQDQGYGEHSARKKMLDRSAALALSIPHMSINLFTHPLIQNFVYALDPKYKFPTSFRGLRSLMDDPVKELKKRVKREIAGFSLRPSITADIWTTSSLLYSYVGVTMHYANAESGKLDSLFLGLKQLDKSHTFDYVRESIIEVLDQFDLSMDSIFKVVSDNGSNFVAAFSEMEVYDGNNGDSITPNNLDQRESQQDDDEESCDDNNDCDDFPEYDETDETMFELTMPVRIPCFAHALQNNLSKCLKKTLEEYSGFKKIRSLISKFRKSHQATRMLYTQTGKTLIKACLTRWGYWIAVLDRFFEVQKDVKAIARAKKWGFPEYEELEFLKTVLDSIKMHGEILEQIQSEKNVTISSCYGHLKILHNTLDEAIETHQDKNFVNTIIVPLRDDLDSRFSFILNTKDRKFEPCYLVASALDPSECSLLDETEIRDAGNYICRMLSTSQSQDVNNSIATVEEQLPEGKMSSLQAATSKLKLINERKRYTSVPSADLKGQIDRALEMVQSGSTQNPIMFWTQLGKDFTRIKNLALEIFSIPCTSAPIERVFSWATFATAKHRSNTGPKLLDDQLFLYLNHKLLTHSLNDILDA